MNNRSRESEARIVIGTMLVLTVIIAAGVLVSGGLSVTVKSMILIGWIGVMMMVLRRYR
ncbi:MAG: hypothetical protein JW966_00210 [Anaerolineae bacterium]|nr:hypothetical protein [Anaerolineae bacterium]